MGDCRTSFPRLAWGRGRECPCTRERMRALSGLVVNRTFHIKAGDCNDFFFWRSQFDFTDIIFGCPRLCAAECNISLSAQDAQGGCTTLSIAEWFLFLRVPRTPPLTERHVVGGSVPLELAGATQAVFFVWRDHVFF